MQCTNDYNRSEFPTRCAWQIGHKAFRRDHEHPFLPQREGHGPFREDRREGVVQHVQPAGKGTHGWHYQPRAITGKTSPPHGSAPSNDLGRRMQMPGYLPCFARRLMPENQRSDAQHLAGPPAQMRRRVGVMVALHPDPVMCGRQRLNAPGIGFRQAQLGRPIEITVFGWRVAHSRSTSDSVAPVS